MKDHRDQAWAAVYLGMAAVSLALAVLAVLRQSYTFAMLAAITCINVAVRTGSQLAKARRARAKRKE